MVRACPSCGKKNRIPAANLASQGRCGKCGTSISPVDGPLPVESAAELDELLKGSPLPVLVDFWAPWCGPCRAVAPQLEQLARAKAGKVVIAKLDTESLPDVASRYGIQGIPTLVHFRGGAEVNRVTGAMPAKAIEDAFGI